MKYINANNIFDYAFINEDTLVYPLRGICVYFHGYTDSTMYESSHEIARALGEQGIAWVFPYYSVWAWMSRNSQEFNEQVICAAYERLKADESIPLIVSGGSMGGLTALNYLVYGKRKAIGCALNCPVTDMNRIFADFYDFRRAILSAHIDQEGDLEDVMGKYSPVRFADRLPQIPYLFVFGENDRYFIEKQMPPILERFEHYRLPYELIIQPRMGHCDIRNHPDALSKYCDFIISLV